MPATDDDDGWNAPSLAAKFYRTASVGSWGVTSIGRGFDWNDHGNDHPRYANDRPRHNIDQPCHDDDQPRHNNDQPCHTNDQLHHCHPSPNFHPVEHPLPLAVSPSLPSPSSPRPRRRSSRQRVSLIAGRVSIAPIEPPSPPPLLPQSLRRTSSSGSLLSIATSTRPPSPSEKESFLGTRTISDFVIEDEIGRGAYGLVKRARELRADSSAPSPLVIKQIIKSRILADCWKKHPKHGTIPIEIYVMSAISNTSYVLPTVRPWDPSRVSMTPKPLERRPVDLPPDDLWVQGKVVKGHPNICPLLDFFEDHHFYYLVLPSTTPQQQPNEPPPASDLFDLVETYPQGLPANAIRTYLGQMADALCFLHSHGIVHRDVKDENVVLGPGGKCILIDFGSSGLVKKNGWDTFSGTLDYAGPEILRGERYHGKEQDVWAFGVVAYVLLVGECPFMTAEETQEGLESPFAKASIALDERCGEEVDEEEGDGGGALGDAAALVRACLQVDVAARPTFEKILRCRFLAGRSEDQCV